jgi:integrase
VLRLIKRVLADARARGQRVHEPVFAIEPPHHEERDPRFLTWAEVEELASYCREHRLIVVAALSGLRRGELFALTASNVDLEGAAITVAATGDGARVGRPKGGNVRRVHVERRVVELLADQLRERVSNAGDLVFPSQRGAMWDGSNFRERVFDPAKKRAAGEMIFHDLRHTYASLLIAANVQPTVVAAQLGHTDARLVLQRYGHLYPGAAAQAAMALDLFLQAQTVGQTFGANGGTDAEELETPMDADGACRARTGDPQLAKLVLSQLS